ASDQRSVVSPETRYKPARGRRPRAPARRAATGDARSAEWWRADALVEARRRCLSRERWRSERPMIVDLKEFADELFKSAQQPVAWLLSAERLCDAAEAILERELPNEVPYFEARAEAEREAATRAYSEGEDAGVAEIRAAPPNYPPAQLLYAYAIENVLKGLAVAK